MYDWLVSNKLTLNTNKSKFMITTRKKCSQQDFLVQLNGTNLEKCDSYKYLGVHLDKDLNWKAYINYVTKKV